MIKFKLRYFYWKPWYWRFYNSAYGLGEGYCWTKKEAKKEWIDCAVALEYIGENSAA